MSPIIVVPPFPPDPLNTASVEESVHRSVRKLIAAALGVNTDSGAPWIVVLEERAVPVEKRPLAVVAWIAGVTTERTTRRSMPQGLIMRFMTFVVTAYPERGEDARAATLRAARVTSLLLDAIEVGLVDVDANQVASYPLAVPVYDYSLAADDPASGVITQQAQVIDHSVQPIPDPQDDRLYSVVATIRVRYYRPGRIRAIGGPPPTVVSLPGTPDITP